METIHVILFIALLLVAFILYNLYKKEFLGTDGSTAHGGGRLEGETPEEYSARVQRAKIVQAQKKEATGQTMAANPLHNANVKWLNLHKPDSDIQQNIRDRNHKIWSDYLGTLREIDPLNTEQLNMRLQTLLQMQMQVIQQADEYLTYFANEGKLYKDKLKIIMPTIVKFNTEDNKLDGKFIDVKHNCNLEQLKLVHDAHYQYKLKSLQYRQRAQAYILEELKLMPQVDPGQLQLYQQLIDALKEEEKQVIANGPLQLKDIIKYKVEVEIPNWKLNVTRVQYAINKCETEIYDMEHRMFAVPSATGLSLQILESRKNTALQLPRQTLAKLKAEAVELENKFPLQSPQELERLNSILTAQLQHNLFHIQNRKLEQELNPKAIKWEQTNALRSWDYSKERYERNNPVVELQKQVNTLQDAHKSIQEIKLQLSQLYQRNKEETDRQVQQTVDRDAQSRKEQEDKYQVRYLAQPAEIRELWAEMDKIQPALLLANQERKAGLEILADAFDPLAKLLNPRELEDKYSNEIHRLKRILYVAKKNTKTNDERYLVEMTEWYFNLEYNNFSRWLLHEELRELKRRPPPDAAARITKINNLISYNFTEQGVLESNKPSKWKAR